MRDAADREQRFQLWQCRHAPDQKLPAIGNFTGDGLVRWRHAAHRVGDHAIDEFERLGRGDVMLASRQTHFQQRAIEQLPGMVAEKRTPGAIGAFETRREAHDQQPRILDRTTARRH